MSIYSHLYSIKNIAIIIFILCSVSFLFAEQPRLDQSFNRGYIESHDIPERKKKEPAPNLYRYEEKNLTGLQRQARVYRAQGLEYQRIGNIDEAMAYYQKAIELDPAYAAPYNDLGIILEAKGLIDRAEEAYLRCIEIDPNYLSAYTNLALLYENKRDLNKSSIYWKKRAELGSPDDPWTQKARNRAQDISLVLSDRPLRELIREQEVVELLKDVAAQKTLLRKDDKALSRHHFEKAKQSYNKQDYATAIKEALDAQHLDSANEEIEKFIEKTQTRALSR